MLGREKLLLKLKSKLFGPGLGNPDDNNNYDHEIIDGRMDLSYLVGILYPQEYENIDNTDYNREENDDGEFGNVDPDDPLNVAEERMPSSLGFSVCLTKNSIVKVKISAARYISFKDENEKEIKSEQGDYDRESNLKKNKQKSFKWKRHPLGPEREI